MAERKEDLTGKTFGRWTVLSFVEKSTNGCKSKFAKYLCQCSCANHTIKEVFASNLKRGLSLSCGCLRNELSALRKKTNDYVILNNIVIIYTRKNIPFLIDIEDFGRVYKHCWTCNNQGYFITTIYDESKCGETTQLLHRLIMGNPLGMKVDHKHGSDTKFDNRKSNLRVGSDFQNCVNKAPYKNKSGCVGVRYLKRINRWEARIGVNYKSIHLGYFNSFGDAVRARKEAEEKYYGEWSYGNSRNPESNKKGEVNLQYCHRLFQLSCSIEG